MKASALLLLLLVEGASFSWAAVAGAGCSQNDDCDVGLTCKGCDEDDLDDGGNSAVRSGCAHLATIASCSLLWGRNHRLAASLTGFAAIAAANAKETCGTCSETSTSAPVSDGGPKCCGGTDGGKSCAGNGDCASNKCWADISAGCGTVATPTAAPVDGGDPPVATPTAAPVDGGDSPVTTAAPVATSTAAPIDGGDPPVYVNRTTTTESVEYTDDWNKRLEFICGQVEDDGARACFALLTVPAQPVLSPAEDLPSLPLCCAPPLISSPDLPALPAPQSCFPAMCNSFNNGDFDQETPLLIECVGGDVDRNWTSASLNQLHVRAPLLLSFAKATRPSSIRNAPAPPPHLAI